MRQGIQTILDRFQSVGRGLLDWYGEMTQMLPDYIQENIAELIGTLLASILMAVITTYIFNRRQVIQKARGRVLHFRMEMYAQVLECTAKNSDQISFMQNREEIFAAMSLAQIDLNNPTLSAPSLLSQPTRAQAYLHTVEKLCSKGLYILDDDVLGKLLQLKIYLMNYLMFGTMIDGYVAASAGIPAQVGERVKKTFYEYFSLVIAREYEGWVEQIDATIQKKQARVRFEPRKKDYRKPRQRKKLQSALWKDSTLYDNTASAFFLIGLIFGTELSWEDEQLQTGMADWMRYISSVMAG